MALAVLLAGCASAGKVGLLSGESGAAAGAVAVLDPTTGAERGQLTTADTQAALDTRTVKPRPLTGDYGALLSAMPPPPQVFVLYFVEGTTTLSPDSVPTLDALRHAVSATSDVQITGYTDTTGDPASNDKLSLDRAIEVRSALAADGLPVANAKVTGRGQRDLKVPTGPGVNEPANRRVEVVVR
ncbi:OmpA family protein [Caulobacter sp. KR2-114]|uniref:OmpA family protein n=1 Tax=Caulobacter sp. KR2-114 TaxID=3400912 RepID=UPI003C08DC00